jgi:hypothetical protein|tara:strand:- start:1842 stop:2075 length:234 start_codon:yes stop_codon:yes gene_type:complete
MSTKIDDTLHLKNFIDSINKAENARQREIKIDIEHGKRVRNALTTILLLLAEIQSRKTGVSDATEVNDISMDGGGFK